MINRGAIEQMWKQRHMRNTERRDCLKNKKEFRPSYVFTLKSSCHQTIKHSFILSRVFALCPVTAAQMGSSSAPPQSQPQRGSLLLPTIHFVPLCGDLSD